MVKRLRKLLRELKLPDTMDNVKFTNIECGKCNHRSIFKVGKLYWCGVCGKRFIDKNKKGDRICSR